MAKVTGAAIMARALKDQGVQYMFGVVGFPIQPLALNDDPRIGEFYFTYGLALARTNQCGQALPIAQTLQSRFPAEDEMNAVILEAADSIIQICQENLDNPVTPTAESTTLPEATDTPELTATPEASPTP